MAIPLFKHSAWLNSSKLNSAWIAAIIEKKPLPGSWYLLMWLRVKLLCHHWLTACPEHMLTYNKHQKVHLKWNPLELLNRFSYFISTVITIYFLYKKIVKKQQIGKAVSAFGKLRKKARNNKRFVMMIICEHTSSHAL